MTAIKPPCVDTENFSSFVMIGFYKDGSACLLGSCSLEEPIKAKVALSDLVDKEVKKCNANQRAEAANFERSLRLIMRMNETMKDLFEEGGEGYEGVRVVGAN